MSHGVHIQYLGEFDPLLHVERADVYKMVEALDCARSVLKERRSMAICNSSGTSSSTAEGGK